MVRVLKVNGKVIFLTLERALMESLMKSFPVWQVLHDFQVCNFGGKFRIFNFFFEFLG